MTTQRKLNTQEAADYLGIRPNTLEVWRCKHRGPKYSKIGSRVLYAMEDLESFFNAKAVYTRDVSRSSGNALRQEG